MTLSADQYDNIMQEYAQTRERHRRELAHRRAVVYAHIPQFRDLENQVPDLGQKALQKMLRGPEQEESEEAGKPLREEIAAVSARKKALLQESGFPADYLEMQYDCPDCHDTGYVDGQKCHCLLQREKAILYDQSNLSRLLETNNFSLLSEEYYQGEDLAAFRRALAACQRFIRNFNSHYENLYFYGTVGTGKSFLSICTAGALMEQGHEVLYFSASSLFERLADAAFRGGSRSQYRDLMQDLDGCDCLVIDDLGTEMTNGFVSSQLFAILNTRALQQKAVIISTNLTLKEMQERYSDRIFSRITSGFTICRLTGSDIRIQKKFRAANGGGKANDGTNS